MMPDHDEALDESIKQFFDQHRIQKKQKHFDKDRSSRNVLLEKYDTCRALALKARAKLEEERLAKKKKARGNDSDSEEDREKDISARIAAMEKPEHKQTTISSPVRGKVRPRSAPARRPMKSQSAPQLRASSPPHMRPNDRTHSPVWSPSGKYQQFDMYETTQNPDQWWYDKTLNHMERGTDRGKRPKTPNSTSKLKAQQRKNELRASNGMTRQELKESLQKSRGKRPARIPPSVHLANYREKEKQHADAIAKAVMEEAFLMESRAYACVEEACAYAKSLGIKKRFSVYSKTAAESAHGRALARAYSTPFLGGADVGQQQQKKEALKKTAAGAGRRIERMMIEVMGEPGEPTQLIPLDKFYAEHDRLQMEVRRQRNLMPSSQRVLEMQLEKEIEVNKEKNGTAVKRRGMKSEVANIDDMLLITSKKKQGDGVKLTKKEKEDQLNQILADTVEATRVLEEQLRELQSRGWNESVF